MPTLLDESPRESLSIKGEPAGSTRTTPSTNWPK